MTDIEKEILVVTLNNKAEMLRRSGLYDEARRYFEYALSIVEKTKISDSSISALLSNYGLLLVNLNKYHEAIWIQKKALSIDRNSRIDANIAFSLHNLGCAFMGIDKHDKAVHYLEEAKDIRYKINDFDELIKTYEMLSTANLALDKIDAAKKYVNKAMSIKDKVKDKYYLRNIYASLSNIYEQESDWEKASEAQMIAINMLEEHRHTFNNIEKINEFDKRHSKHYLKAIECCMMAERFNDSLSLIDASRFRSGCDSLEKQQKFRFPCKIFFPRLSKKEMLLVEWIYPTHDWSFCITRKTKKITAKKIITSNHKGKPIKLDFNKVSHVKEHHDRRLKQTQKIINHYKDTIGNYDRLVIVPHGTQWHTPFVGLLNPATNDFLCKTHEIVVVPSLRYCKITQNRKMVYSKNVLVIGDPSGDLCHARSEAEYIANKFNTTPVIGKQATKKAILNKIKNNKFDFVHYAGHSSLIHKGQPGIILNDGVITPANLKENNFSTNVLNLSSCWSGFVVDDTWNELFGFIRESLTMKINYVLSSIYPCDDEAVKEFNKKFYDQYDNIALNKIDVVTAFNSAIKSLTGKFDIEKFGGLYITGIHKPKKNKVRNLFSNPFS